MTMRQGIILGSTGMAAVVAGVFLLMGSTEAPAQTVPSGPLVAASYELLNEKRVSRTVYDYTYRVIVANSGPIVEGVVGTATSTAPNVAIIDSTIEVPMILNDDQSPSTDTIVIRQDRTQALRLDLIRWTFVARNAVATTTATNVRFANTPRGIILPSLRQDGGAELYSPVNTAALEAGNVITPPDITVTTVPNPGQLALESFITSYSDGWYGTYQSRQTRTVSGRTSLFVDDSASTLPHFPSRAVLIPNADTVIIITGENVDTPTISEFETFLSSFEIQ